MHGGPTINFQLPTNKRGEKKEKENSFFFVTSPFSQMIDSGFFVGEKEPTTPLLLTYIRMESRLEKDRPRMFFPFPPFLGGG